MPALKTNRDFLPLARANNRAKWTDQREYRDGYMQRFVAEQEAKSDRAEAEYLAARRARLVERINKVVAAPSLYWNDSYFRHLRCVSFVDTADAVREVQRALTYWRNRPTYGRRPEIVQELREALVFARWFRRFAARVWQRRAA